MLPAVCPQCIPPHRVIYCTGKQEECYTGLENYSPQIIKKSNEEVLWSISEPRRTDYPGFNNKNILEANSNPQLFNHRRRRCYVQIHRHFSSWGFQRFFSFFLPFLIWLHAAYSSVELHFVWTPGNLMHRRTSVKVKLHHQPIKQNSSRKHLHLCSLLWHTHFNWLVFFKWFDHFWLNSSALKPSTFLPKSTNIIHLFVSDCHCIYVPQKWLRIFSKRSKTIRIFY